MSSAAAMHERAQLLGDLHQIVQFMKTLALAELQRIARLRLAHAQARDALAQAQQQLPGPADGVVHQPRGSGAWLLIGAERGFCGAFNTQLSRAAIELRRQDPAITLLVASRRLMSRLNSSGEAVTALPGCAASEESDGVISQWLPAVYKTIDSDNPVMMLHMTKQGLAKQRLWPAQARPVETSGGNANHPTSALLYLPAVTLREALARQALRLAIEGALYASLEEESHWRLAQMQRANDHLEELGQMLKRRYATLRQTSITTELETLTSSIAGGTNS